MSAKNLIIGAAAVILTAAACGGPGTVELIDAIQREPTILDVGVKVCNPPELTASFEESEESVIVIAWASDTGSPFGGDACAEFVRIELTEPLGDRVVIDGTTNDEVRVDVRNP